MITSHMLYWITRLDGLSKFSIFITVLTAMAAIIVLLTGVTLSASQEDCFTSKEEAGNRKKTVAKLLGCWMGLLLSFLVAMLLSILTPTTKEMAAIVIIPQIVNNEKVQDVGGRLYELAVEWMDELKPASHNAEKVEAGNGQN